MAGHVMQIPIREYDIHLHAAANPDGTCTFKLKVKQLGNPPIELHPQIGVCFMLDYIVALQKRELEKLMNGQIEAATAAAQPTDLRVS